MTKKSTMIELVQELTDRNVNGKYDSLIAEARAGEYHDFKNVKYVCGKTVLVEHLSRFPELESLTIKVMRGDFDETPDEEDKERMRKQLIENCGKDQAERMFKMLGL